MYVALGAITLNLIDFSEDNQEQSQEILDNEDDINDNISIKDAVLDALTIEE